MPKEMYTLALLALGCFLQGAPPASLVHYATKSALEKPCNYAPTMRIAIQNSDSNSVAYILKNTRQTKTTQKVNTIGLQIACTCNGQVDCPSDQMKHYKKMVYDLLYHGKADVHANNDWSLKNAAINGYYSFVALLLYHNTYNRNGADTVYSQASKDIALYNAAQGAYLQEYAHLENRYVQCMELLMLYKANPSTNLMGGLLLQKPYTMGKIIMHTIAKLRSQGCTIQLPPQAEKNYDAYCFSTDNQA